jgi:aspartate racemase
MKAIVIALLSTVLSAQSAPGNKSTQLPLASDMKTLGLVGGTSWYSTVDYYRYINKAVNDAYGDNTNPPLIIFNLNQQRFMSFKLRTNGTRSQRSLPMQSAVSTPAGLKRFCSVQIRRTRSTPKSRKIRRFQSCTLWMRRAVQFKSVA